MLAVLLVVGVYGVCEEGSNHNSMRRLNCARITNPRKCMAVNGACAWRDESEIMSAREFDADELEADEGYYAYGAQEYDDNAYADEEAELFEAEEEWAEDEIAAAGMAVYSACCVGRQHTHKRKPYANTHRVRRLRR